MKQNNVEVFLGHELSDPTEQKFLRRLREDLEHQGLPALILANLEVSPRHRQLDFVIATAVRTVQCELKGYQLPVIGSTNGRWELILPGGEHRSLDSNAARQAKEGTFALSDELKAFSRNAGAPAPERNQFYRKIDTVVCVFPEIPEGSRIDTHSHVTVKGYESLLASLSKKGPRLPWKDEHWRAFIRHLRLYRVEDRPELAQRERQHGQLVEDYCRRFLSSHRAGLPTQVVTAARVDGEDAKLIELGARLRRGEAVTVFGPSGVGKTLMSRYAAVELAEAGQVPIWLDAADYDGHFDALLGRAVSPFTTHSAGELIRAAGATGRAVAVIVDGLNETPPASRTDLLDEVGALRLNERTGVVMSCLSPGALPETLSEQSVELLLPDRAEKKLVLQAYDAGELAPHSDAFSTPFELVLAGECAGDFSEAPTRALVLDAYVRRLAPSEGARSVLRALATQMHSELRGSLPVQETVRHLQRETAVSAETVDLALESQLLRVHQGRLAFSHESFVRFLAAEALVIDSADARAFCAALAQPANAELRADALARETDERLEQALSTLEDENVLIAAMIGDLGERCRTAMERVIFALLERARRVTARAELSDQTSREMEGRTWTTSHTWTADECALLSVLGRALHGGHVAQGVIELIEQTDERCLDILDERGRSSSDQAVSAIVASTYALPLMEVSRTLPATIVFKGCESERSSRYRQPNVAGDIASRLVESAGPRSWGLLLLAATLLHRFDAAEYEIVPDLLSKSWAAGGYHLRLSVLHLVHDVSWTIKGAARERVKDTLQAIDSRNWAIGSVLVEALDAYGLVDGRGLDEVEREIADALGVDDADVRGDEQARSIVSMMFEPEGIVGPYSEAIEALEDDQRTRLYLRATRSASADDLSTDVALAELERIGDLGDPQIQAPFIKLMRFPDPSAWHGAQWGMRSCLVAVRACARFALEPVLPGSESDDLQGWRVIFGLLYWLERDRLHNTESSEPVRVLVDALAEPRARAGSLAVLEMIHSSDVLMNPDELPSVHDRLVNSHREDMRGLLRWGLTHPQELTSCFRWRDDSVNRYIVKMLGVIGDRESVGPLRARANDPELASCVREAVRSIEERLAAST
jgi:Nuclease-related domain